MKHMKKCASIAIQLTGEMCINSYTAYRGVGSNFWLHGQANLYSIASPGHYIAIAI